MTPGEGLRTGGERRQPRGIEVLTGNLESLKGRVVESTTQASILKKSMQDQAREALLNDLAQQVSSAVDIPKSRISTDAWREQYQMKLNALKKEVEDASPEVRLKGLSTVIASPPFTESQPATFDGEIVIAPEGSGFEIILQGFNWESHRKDWYAFVESQAEFWAAMGFSCVWLPPPTDSVSPQGYMPRDLYNLNSAYGSTESLLRAIAKLQSVGIKVIGDAVLNHRCAQAQDSNGIWNVYGGRLDWDARAIVSDDHNFKGRGGKSSGEAFHAAPNIDHNQPFVKRDMSEWLCWMRSYAGFDGWRLDFVKGFSGKHVADYMNASRPTYVVGEYWDALSYSWEGVPHPNQDAHRQRIVNWLNQAEGTATAFDVTTKGILHAVFERCEYWRLKDSKGNPPGLIGWWPSRSTTFLENHDTGSTQGHWRFPSFALEQGYAYILTHPGTPCVFFDHLEDPRLLNVVRRLIALRRRTGIHCRSQVKIIAAERDVYVAIVDDRLFLKMGPGQYTVEEQKWKLVEGGNNFAVYESVQG
eukprot:jgi/Botrbrau1/12138/Bobra.0186s0053.1